MVSLWPTRNKASGKCCRQAAPLLFQCLETSFSVLQKFCRNLPVSLKKNLFHVKQHYGTRRFPYFEPFLRATR